MSDDVNMDEMWSGEVDQDELTKGQADLLMPKGSYQAVGPRTLTFNEDTDKFSGRPPGSIARIFGEFCWKAREKDVAAGLAKEVGQEIARGRVGFSVSPKRVNSKERGTDKDTGKPDRAFRLWMQANTAYKQAYQQVPSSGAEVLAFLRDYPDLGVFITQYNVPTERDPEPEGEPGNSVSSIYIPKE